MSRVQSVCSALDCTESCWGFWCPEHAEPDEKLVRTVARGEPFEHLLQDGEPLISELPPAQEGGW